MTDYEEMTNRNKYRNGFTWGDYIETHTAANFQIVEFLRDGISQFHPFIDGKDTRNSYATLKRAIVGAIAYEAEGPNHYADSYFFKMIDQKE